MTEPTHTEISSTISHLTFAVPNADADITNEKVKESKSRKDLSRLLLTSTLGLLFNRLGLRFRFSLVSSSRSGLSRSSSSWLSGGLRFGILLLRGGSGFARTASSSGGFLWLLLLLGFIIIRFFSVVGSRFFFFFFLCGFLAARGSLGLFGGGFLLLFLAFVVVFVLGLGFGGSSTAAFLGFRSFLLFLGGVLL